MMSASTARQQQRARLVGQETLLAKAFNEIKAGVFDEKEMADLESIVNKIEWSPVMRNTFLQATPWLKECTLEQLLTNRDKWENTSVTMNISFYEKNAQGFRVSHACTALTLATLNNSLPDIQTCFMGYLDKGELRTLLAFLLEVHTYCKKFKAEQAFVGMGQLIVEAEKSRHQVYDSLDATQKDSLKLQLLKEIDEAKDIPGLRAIHEKYQRAQFFEHRDHSKIDAFRAWRNGAVPYTQTKIYFIQALQEKAYSMLINHKVDKTASIMDDNAYFLYFLFSFDGNNDLINRCVPKDWQIKYAELDAFVKVNKEQKDMSVPEKFDVVNARDMKDVACYKTLPVPRIR